jgi:hypothetical protein
LCFAPLSVVVLIEMASGACPPLCPFLIGTPLTAKQHPLHCIRFLIVLIFSLPAGA